MIDYTDIGTRIRAARRRKGLTQEQLADAVDVGTTHISHIETGNTIPSLKTFIAIVNVLGCSADELLCRELKTAKTITNNWVSELLADCNTQETKIISDTIVSLKTSLRNHIETE